MNNLFSHEFNTSPILCSLLPSLLEMALGHRGLPGPPAAPPVGLASRSGSDRAAILLHGMGAGSALDRAGKKGKSCPWWCVFISVAVMLAAGSGGWECRLRLLGSMRKAEAVPEPGRDAAVYKHGHSLSVSLWTSDTSELPSLPSRTLQAFTSIWVPHRGLTSSQNAEAVPAVGTVEFTGTVTLFWSVTGAAAEYVQLSLPVAPFPSLYYLSWCSRSSSRQNTA